MSSIRMTEDLRIKIVNRALFLLFKEKENDLAMKFKGFGDNLYERYVEDSAIIDAPEGWFGLSSEIPVKEGVTSYFKLLPMSKERRFPYSYLQRRNGIPLSEQEQKALDILNKEKDEIYKQKTNIRGTLISILKRTNTVKQFLDIFPEGEQYLPENILKEKNELTVPIDTLKKQIEELK